jgi:hypothetical protein
MKLVVGEGKAKEIKEIETKNKSRRNFNLERNTSELMCFLGNSDTIIIIIIITFIF